MFLLFLFLAVQPGLSAAPAAPDTLVYAHSGAISTLDPVYPYDALTQGMLFNVYETLVRFSGPSLTALEPALAAKVPSEANGLISKDGRTYIFPLRKGVKFHNGDVLTPEDVRYSLLRFMLSDPEGGPAALLLEPVFGLTSSRGPGRRLAVSSADFENAVKVKGNSVVVRLKRPFAPFLSIMARWSYVTDKKWCAANGEWDGAYRTLGRFNNRPKESSYLFKAMNGTGPFMLDRWDSAAGRLLLTAFPGYRGGPAASPRVLMLSVPAAAARLRLLADGEADIIDLPRSFGTRLEGLPGVRLEEDLPRLATDPVFFFTLKVNPAGNTDIGSGRLDGQGIPPDFFSSLDVRRAFAASFDYSSFIRNGLNGKAARALGPIPPGLLGYALSAPAPEFDRARAEEYFRKAYAGKVWNKGFRLTLSYNTGDDARRLACEALKRGVEAMNPRFHVDLRGVDWAIYLANARGRKMPLYARGWTGDYPDPHNFIFPFYHSKGRFALEQGYADPEMDKLIEAAVSETSPAQRTALYAKIQEAAYENALQIYAAHPLGVYALRDRVKGFYDNAVFMGIYFYPLGKR
jgi:peptide/nickel transport system substrate-binding protein